MISEIADRHLDRLADLQLDGHHVTCEVIEEYYSLINPLYRDSVTNDEVHTALTLCEEILHTIKHQPQA